MNEENLMSHDVEVLIVGAGPVGLSTALQLGAEGVDTLVVERRSTLSRHPKAAGVHARTMEIFRQMGLADRIRAAGLPPGEALGFAWMTRVDGIELGSIMLADDAERLAEYAQQSPEAPCFIPQDKLEPILAEALAEHPSVELRFATEAVALDQDDTGVTVTLRERGDASERRVRARYVVAADGVRSRVRSLLGITETAAEPYGESVNVYFASEQLDALRRGRPYLLWWVVNADTQGAFWPVSHAHRWIYNFEGDVSLPDEHFDEELCTGLIRKAAGVDDLAIEILSILRWQHEQAVADRWRVGRVLLVGDAAHRFPPHGGFGMNSGVQDSANLAWKLAAVLRGRAGDALLDSYELERKPVAELNARQCTLNTKKMEETGWLMPDPSELAAIEEPEGAPLRERIAAAIPKQREQFFSQGQQFGALYASPAVIDDGREPVRSTVGEYRMTSTPGARSPHRWVTDADGARRSTIDLPQGGFVLLTGADGGAWLDAAAEVAPRHGVRLAAYRVAADGDLRPEDGAAFEAAFEVAADGAVLVRPDGHVGFRSAALPDDPADALDEALGRILASADHVATVN